MAGNSSWDQAAGKNLVWFGELERKFSQIIKDYFPLPFFLLIILCLKVMGGGVHLQSPPGTWTITSPPSHSLTLSYLCIAGTCTPNSLAGGKGGPMHKVAYESRKYGYFPPFHSSQLPSIHSSVLEYWWPYAAFTLQSP
jgi:hypothetical protein